MLDNITAKQKIISLIFISALIIVIVTAGSTGAFLLIYLGIYLFAKAKKKNGQIVDIFKAMVGNILAKSNSPVATVASEGVNSLSGYNFFYFGKKKSLNKNSKYLQVALNGTLAEAKKIVLSLPKSEKIIIEVGTPLLKVSGMRAITDLRSISADVYIVADMKISDNAEAEVEMVATAGASAVTCLGVASLQTIDKFIKACDLHKLDSMIDLMNVADPLTLFKKLKKIPKVAIIHRGVDETEKTKGKTIPYYQINKLKGAFGAMVAIAGGDDPREVQSAIFNGANIVVVWKNFLKADAGAGMVQAFLKDIK